MSIIEKDWIDYSTLVDLMIDEGYERKVPYIGRVPQF